MLTSRCLCFWPSLRFHTSLQSSMSVPRTPYNNVILKFFDSSAVCSDMCFRQLHPQYTQNKSMFCGSLGQPPTMAPQGSPERKPWSNRTRWSSCPVEASCHRGQLGTGNRGKWKKRFRNAFAHCFASKRRSFPIKIRVIWVPGICMYLWELLYNCNVYNIYMIQVNSMHVMFAGIVWVWIGRCLPARTSELVSIFPPSNGQRKMLYSLTVVSFVWKCKVCDQKSDLTCTYHFGTLHRAFRGYLHGRRGRG